MKVILVSNLPTSYFLDFATELNKYLDVKLILERNINLHTKTTVDLSVLQKELDLVVLNAKTISPENGLSFKIIDHLKRKDYDVVIFCNPCTYTGIIGELFCKFNKIPYIIQSEGGFQGTGEGFKEKFKKFIMSSAALYFTGCRFEDNYFLKYGATLDKLRKFNFSSQHNYQIDNSPLSSIEKKNLKLELGIKNDKMIICVAQFIHRKGIDTLLEACANLPFDTDVYIIGGIPTDEYFKLIEKFNLKNIHFIERIPFEKLSDFYRAADLFVLLSREDIWGLVINEAMSHGLPVITTTAVLSGVNLIQNDINGFLIQPNDPKAAHEKMSFLLNNPNKRLEMGIKNLEKIKEYSIEKMAETISGYLLNCNFY